MVIVIITVTHDDQLAAPQTETHNGMMEKKVMGIYGNLLGKGIGGGRWNKDEFWTTNYINERWIEMPKKYNPENKSILTDNGAYW